MDWSADPHQLFAPLGEVKHLLVAVSGGPDSMALLHLARRWHEAGGAPVHAATVDHALRVEARAEAEMVAHWCAALDVPHHILTWSGEKPSTRLQERAREARYALLFDHARSLGADVVATGHHADDQAETILFRLLRGSGIAGLAGMEAVSQREGLRLARPLLGTAKAQLVAFCNEVGQAFIEDPSNSDPRFARTGLRRLMGELSQEGLDRGALLRLGRRAARMSALSDAALSDLRARLAPPSGPDFVVNFSDLASAPDEAVLRLLRAEIARIGAGQPPRLEQVEAVFEALQAAAGAGGPHRSTLGGVLIDLSCAGELALTPAPPRRG